ncbi:E3 ubiquitin-protein ligase RNF170-like [Stomoxys calcitrans]|uniref:RING-type domain-containing protein n=1 Tax=Stomoxys calcitrans TaxID=35570 RepID=A0A1I8Q7Y3_STOCA|nr:E3 ubiquitin-protein ligase RNF170-like [Stomoxys calcitrans]
MADQQMDLQCAICLEQKQSPTAVTCGHSFCHTCLEEYMTYVGYEWSKECPICGSRLKIINDNENFTNDSDSNIEDADVNMNEQNHSL